MNKNKNTLLASAWTDKLSEDYVNQWGELLLHKKVADFCKLSPTEVVVDIGCGSGSAVRAIANKLTTGHVTGIDPTPKMIEMAIRLTEPVLTTQKINYALAGVESIPIESKSCDLVVAVNSLHHWLNIDDGFSEIRRILKSSGRFVSIDDLWEESPEYNQVKIDQNEPTSCKSELKTRQGIINLLKRQGFTDITNDEHREPGATASIITAFRG
jgi:ubiquinone/menaquinone biosynthesis C-methylase UbiE